MNLDNVQGNIIKGFARRHTRHLFLQFHSPEPSARARLSEILQLYVVSAAKQAAITKDWKKSGQTNSPGVGMVGISCEGYKKLGIPDLFPTQSDLGAPVFREGMKNPAYRPGSLQSWEPEYASGVHGLLLLSDDCPDRLAETAAQATQAMAGLATVVKGEAGGPIFNDPATRKQEIEPFGFRDQISTPMDPNLVFSPEPRDPASNFGCFAAFMKLEQDTEQFRKLCRDFSQLLSSIHVFVSPEEVAARMVGRFRNGEPLVPRGTGLDDFDFSSDPEGALCPYQSHIRIMNPRDGAARGVMVRRGVAYSNNEPPASGLLFLAFFHSLFDFFKLMMRATVNRDPLLSGAEFWGEGLEPTHCLHGFKAQKWKIAQQEICFQFANVTTMKGGEFFYMPSMSLIRDLAAL
jgi:deferrochelatase/peroxidase EfeB